MSLNEKTLELNIASEFLQICRQCDPQAFMFGTILRQESHSGYDSTVLGNLPPFWRSAIFQFKRALNLRTTVFGDEYTYHINNNGNCDQHIFLWLMSGGRRFTSLYVLPLFITLNDVRNQSPNLLARTVYVDAVDIPPWFVGNSPHTLLVYPNAHFAIVQSERKKIDIFTSENIAKFLSEKKIGVPIEMLRKNLKFPQIKGAETISKRPKFTFQLFPGK